MTRGFKAARTIVNLLRVMKYPVTFKTPVISDDRYPGQDDVTGMGRWVDSLDRI